MSRKASNFQKVVMSRIYRGKEIFKLLNTGRIDEHVSCIREWIANIFFYTRSGTTIMIDAGYNYERLAEKMAWLDINAADIKDVLIITGHTGWTDNLDWAFAHRTEVCNSLRRKPKVHDPLAPYDGYKEDDDTEEKARTVRLAKQIERV